MAVGAGSQGVGAEHRAGLGKELRSLQGMEHETGQIHDREGCLS